MRSRIEPMKKFARNLRNKPTGILAHCRWPIPSSLFEGTNNKIKTIKHATCGFRHGDYFFLKIHQTFPGIA